MVKFAEISPDGFPVAFYSPDIHGENIPPEAIEITEAEWSEFINNAGRRRWDGEKVVEYTPPPQPEPIPNEISRRQFFHQLANMEIITRDDALAALTGGVIPSPLQDIISGIPSDDDKFNARMLIIGATTFNRRHPLSETVRVSLSWTEQQKDDFWVSAYKL